jgi:sulfhydrogenase subunit beta (sulfur reductase)
MKALKLKMEDLYVYLESLKSYGELWGPVAKGEHYSYAKLDNVHDVALQALRTIIPPKKFFVPPRFNMFRYSEDHYTEVFDDVKPRVLFGLHPCDIHGLMILDELFLDRFPDPYYKRRREATAIIGLSCIPDDKCMARSTNTHAVEGGFDLAFNELGEEYLVWVGSSLGDDLVRLNLDLFNEEIDAQNLQKYLEWRRKRDSRYKLNFDLTGMPDIMELSWDSDLWQELADKCLACGACSMVCPTCNCYNIRDISDLSLESGVRERHWDSCMNKEYALVAGGHNFREARAERLKLWYTHKLKAFITEYGKPSCVGCGRCIDTCPVNINVAEVIRALKGQEVKA